jgi:hypothetical protein
MDRTVVTGMVEDYYRAFIAALQNGGVAAATEASQRFEQRIQQTAEFMEPVESAAFLQMLDAERERMIGEYQQDPVALKRRLGIALGVDAPIAHGAQQGGSLGDLAVRTVVRATIWEGIWALFRAVR